MKATTGIHSYNDEKTGVKVVIKYWITDESFDHEFGTSYRIGFDSDLLEVKDKDGKDLIIKDDSIEEIIDSAFDDLEYKSIRELIENSDNYDDQYSVGWQYLNNNKIIWDN